MRDTIPPPASLPSPPLVHGIDVSTYQGDIDWIRVSKWRGAKGEQIDFAIARATYGNAGKDNKFERNWQAIQAVGLIRGAYAFADPDDVHGGRDPEAECEHFAEQLESFRPGIDVGMLDIEKVGRVVPGPGLVRWVRRWLQRWIDLTNTRALVYTGGPFFDSNDGDPSEDDAAFLREHPLVLAAYVKDPTRFIPSVWRSKGWAMHQRSGDQAPSGEVPFRIDGIAGNVDHDVFRGTVDDLRRMITNLVIATPREPVVLGDGSVANDSYYVDRAEAELNAQEIDTAPDGPRAIRNSQPSIDLTRDPDGDGEE